MDFKDVLVPVDFSDASVRALRMAVDVARTTGARLTVLHVGIVPHIYDTELAIVGTPTPVFSELSESMATEQRQHLDRLVRDEVPDDVTLSSVLREGYPPDEIIEQIAAGGHDLVVMGTHGRTGLRRALLGSVTDRVLRRAEVPVLVTR